MDEKTKDAIRMVGYLLETNATDHAWARNRNGIAVSARSRSARKWCLHGAAQVVGSALKLALLNHDVSVYLEMSNLTTWDNKSPNQRWSIIQKLKSI